MASGDATTTRAPRASARARTTSIVCGWQSSATRNTSRVALPRAAWHSAIASAAAVASSSSDALAMGSPASSDTMVW